MLKKTITYETLDGESLTEDFYFNLTQAELIELDMTHNLREKMTRLMDARDSAEIMATYKLLVGVSVGRRSEDGKRFIKSDQIRDEFMQSDAYSELFVSLLKEPGAGADFAAGIMPQKLAAQVDIEQIKRDSFARHGVELPAKAYDASIDDLIPGGIDRNETKLLMEVLPTKAEPKKTLLSYSPEELRAMDIAQFRALVEAHKGSIPKNIINVMFARAGE